MEWRFLIIVLLLIVLSTSIYALAYKIDNTTLIITDASGSRISSADLGYY